MHSDAQEAIYGKILNIFPNRKILCNGLDFYTCDEGGSGPARPSQRERGLYHSSGLIKLQQKQKRTVRGHATLTTPIRGTSTTA